MKNIYAIRVNKVVKAKLEELKIVERDTFNDVIERLLENQPFYTSKTKNEL